MLRYQRMPEGLVHELGLPAHRAMPDAYVTAHHLRDMLNEAPLDQLLLWSGEPGLLPRVPSGQDRGKGWDQVSEVALHALARDRDIDIRFSAEAEMRRRGYSVLRSPLHRSRRACCDGRSPVGPERDSLSPVQYETHRSFGASRSAAHGT